ncbi:MAG: nuclear transport factor 2 family protein [Betaproteobacteria bacterium]
MSDDLRTLEEMNDGYIRSVVGSDAGWFERHLSADFLNSNPDGLIVDRAGFLSQVARTRYTKPDGKAAAGRYTDIWQKRDGRWLCVAAHVTRG